MDGDVVLVTIDCLRSDAVAVTERLRNRSALARGEAICGSAATPGSVPVLLASRYYPTVYDADGELRDLPTLPSVLAAHGYDTAATVGYNPFFEPFAGEFGTFWNGRLDAEGPARVTGYLRRQASKRLARRSVVPAPRVIRRAARWWRAAEPPRLLHVHLMDAHEPYLPGASRWLDVGPIRARRALAAFHEDRLSMTPAQRVTIERLYRESVEFVDAHLKDLFAFVPDDAILVVTADHGEEFDHGAYRHARLYDECVRVPLFVRGLPAVAETDRPRQLDLAPSILARLGIDPPSGWRGEPCDGTTRDGFALNHSPHRGESYVALRTDREKFVRTLRGGHTVEEELYDLAVDPGERRDRIDDRPERRAALADRVEAFFDESMAAGITRGTGAPPESVSTEDLEALGYV